MITKVFYEFFKFPLEDKFFLFLSFSIAILFFISIILVIYAILLRIYNDFQTNHRNYLENKWSIILLDIISGKKTDQELWKEVKKTEQLLFIDFLYQNYKEEQKFIFINLARPYLSAVVKQLKKWDIESRAKAIRILTILGFPDYIDAVVAALDDYSYLVAMVAARSLVRIGNAEYATIILTKLHKFEKWSIKFLASMFIPVGEVLFPKLRQILSDTKQSIRVRAVASEALKEQYDLDAADIALHIIENEIDRDIVAPCLRLLTNVGKSSHLPPIRVLQESSDFVLRAFATSALAHIGEKEDIPRLRKSIEDTSPWVAMHAAKGLKHLGQIDILKEIAFSDHPRSKLAQQVLLGK